MYVDISTVRRGTQSYTRFLLRESFRDEGKVKHRTIANLSQCSAQEIEAIRLALRHKADLSALNAAPAAVINLKQGASFGAVWTVHEVARSLGIDKALGSTREGKLALWQIIARVLDQGSRLSAVRLANAHAVGEILGVGAFDENDLYANLDWLAAHQEAIEMALYAQRTSSAPGLFLYDVTSSYLEGEQNAFAAFGYNRDRKRGKPQVVIGLLCDADGRPLSIEVFPGNTQDTKTFASQIDKVAKRFGGGAVTFVGDRGMIKGPQIRALGAAGCHYITAITKPQIETLLNSGQLQMGLFDESLAEVEISEEERYVLRRNPQRAQEISASRQAKYQALEKALHTANAYLLNHPRAKADKALKRLETRAKKLKIADWVTLRLTERTLTVEKNTEVLTETAKLDGCYVLKTDLDATLASKDLVHARYKDLAQVEWAFRESKTAHLEMRPIFVRGETRTRGHAFVVMLAYLIIQALAERWRNINLTVQEGLDQLATLCLTEVNIVNQPSTYQIPQPRDTVQQLLDAAQVRLPKKLPHPGITVTTKAKLTQRRKSN
jgi:transposase